jgi:hypothetical protein
MQVFKKGRELKEIAGWVRAYARERNWSEPQISAALVDNGHGVKKIGGRQEAGSSIKPYSLFDR